MSTCGRLKHRSQDQGEDEASRLVIEFFQQISYDSKNDDHERIARFPLCAEGPDQAEEGGLVFLVNDPSEKPYSSDPSPDPFNS